MDRALFLAAALTAWTLSPAARAEGRRRVEAKALAEQGDEQFYAGRCDKAMPLWIRADAHFHAPTLVLRVARCQVLLGRVVAAAASLQSIVDEPLSPGAPAAFVAAREDAARELPAVRARIASLRLAVRPPAGGAPITVEIDGSPSAEASGPIPLDPGAHHVTVRAPGGSWTRDVHLEDGESRTLDVALWEEPLPAVPHGPRQAGLVALGLGAAALATGLGLSVSSLSTSRSLENLCGPGHATCPASVESALDRTRAYTLVADGTLAGGAVLVGVGAVLLTTDLHLRQGRRIGLLASPRGLAMRGAF